MNTTITTIASEVGQALLAKKFKLVTAESCTGGWVSQAITSIAGSSDWFDRGFVTYSNQAKQDLLDVSAGTLSKYGAVSTQTAHEMAEGALKNSQANVSLSVTGIAGPDGGTPEKPVGYICFAIAIKNEIITLEQQFSGDREQIRKQSVEFILSTLLATVSSLYN